MTKNLRKSNQVLAKRREVLYNNSMETKDILNFGITSGQAPEPKSDEAEKILKDYVAVANILRKQRNNLLGNFDSNGDYSITDEAILSQLLLLPKKFDRKEDGVVYVYTKFESFVVNFKIVFDMSPSFCKAYLYLIEIEYGVEEDTKHTTLIESKEDVYSPKFKEEIYTDWKVFLEEEVYEKSDYIETLLSHQNETYLFNEELIEILSQLYLIRMLKALENCGELGTKIKEEYKQLLEKLLALDPSLSQNYIKLKMILDQVIQKHNAMPTIMKTQEGVAVVAGYLNPMKKVLSPPAIVKEVGDVDKEKDKKKDEDKKKTVDKPKAKVKGGGGKAKAVKPFDVSKVYGGGKKKDNKKPEPKKLFVGPSKKIEPAPAPVTQPRPQPQPTPPQPTDIFGKMFESADNVGKKAPRMQNNMGRTFGGGGKTL